MKYLTGLTTLALFSILYRTDISTAAPDSIEIDLKDLRTPATNAAKSANIHDTEIDLKELRRQQINRAKSESSQTGKAPSAPSPVQKGGETPPQNKTTSYVVKSGDYLFKILSEHYGISNEAAERMIPEIARLSGLSNPRSLSVGQRLTIPLNPLQVEKHPVRDKKALTAKSPKSDQTPKALQEPAEAPKSLTPSEPYERQVKIHAVPPCDLARLVAENLGLISTQIGSQPESAFTAATSDLKFVVACGLSPDESYTYGRLLSMHKAGLILFKGDESPKSVIDELASRLKLSFYMVNSEEPGTLPLTYVFSDLGRLNQNIRLTVIKESN